MSSIARGSRVDGPAAQAGGVHRRAHPCPVTRLKASQGESLHCPTIRGLDEHTLHKGQRFALMLTLACSIQSSTTESATLWRFTKNNRITEGFHRKMKLIQRRVYGFKNFANYRLRVLAACG